MRSHTTPSQSVRPQSPAVLTRNSHNCDDCLDRSPTHPEPHHRGTGPPPPATAQGRAQRSRQTGLFWAPFLTWEHATWLPTRNAPRLPADLLTDPKHFFRSFTVKELGRLMTARPAEPLVRAHEMGIYNAFTRQVECRMWGCRERRRSSCAKCQRRVVSRGRPPARRNRKVQGRPISTSSSYQCRGIARPGSARLRRASGRCRDGREGGRPRARRAGRHRVRTR